MNIVVFYKSKDISDSITELTNAIGNTLTLLLLIGFIIILILRGISRKYRKRNSNS